MEEERSPILKTWRNVYILVVAVLVVLIIFFYLFTKYFE